LKKGSDKMKKYLRTIYEWAALILIAWLLSFAIRTFLFDTRLVPTGSMLPTIQLNDRVIFDKLFYKFNTLERGDIVMFDPPEISGEKDDLVKRIIGLPGETLEVREGKVWINGEAIDEPYLREKPNYFFGPVEIPEDSYFVMGDNRNNSKDSHVWGFLPKENILGRVLVRYWPLDQFGTVK
jgi:signal peptidase I